MRATKSTPGRHTIATGHCDHHCMLNLEMTCANGIAVVALRGSIETGDDIDSLDAALDFVPVDDHLVIDLGELDHVGPAGTRVIRAGLRSRAEWSESVVVSRTPDVTTRLVLADIDRVAPVVPTLDIAIEIIHARSRPVCAEVA